MRDLREEEERRWIGRTILQGVAACWSKVGNAGVKKVHGDGKCTHSSVLSCGSPLDIVFNVLEVEVNHPSLQVF